MVVNKGHVLFVQEVKTVREDVNRKIEELRADMEKEIMALTYNYSSLLVKFDMIVEGVTKVVSWYNSTALKLDQKVEGDVASFGNISKLLNDLKGQVSEFVSSSSTLLTPEFLTQKFHLLESSIHNELAQLRKFANYKSMNVPPIDTGVQRGRKEKEAKQETDS